MRRAFQEKRNAKDEGENAKYHPGKDPLQQEEKLMIIQPGNEVQTKQTLKMISRMISMTNDKEERNALKMWKSNFKAEQISGIVGREFTHDFWAWLLGRGKEKDHLKTPWYRASVAYDKEVAAYVDSFVSKMHDFRVKLATLDMRQPRGINEYFLFFKFRVRGKALDQTAFLEDWSKFQDEFQEARDTYDQEERDKEQRVHPHEMAPYGEVRTIMANLKEQEHKDKGPVIAGVAANDDPDDVNLSEDESTSADKIDEASAVVDHEKLAESIAKRLGETGAKNTVETEHFLKKLADDVQFLKTKPDQTAAQIQLGNDLADQMAELVTANNDAVDAMEKSLVAQKDLKELSTTISNLQDQLMKSQREGGTETPAALASMERLREERDKLLKEVEAKEGVTAKLIEEKNKAAEEAAKAKMLNDKLYLKIDEMAEKDQAIRKNELALKDFLRKTQQQLDEVTKKYATSSIEIESGSIRVQQLQKELQTLRTQNDSETQAKIADLETKLAKRERLIEQGTKLVQQLEKDDKRLRRTIEELEQEAIEKEQAAKNKETEKEKEEEQTRENMITLKSELDARIVKQKHKEEAMQDQLKAAEAAQRIELETKAKAALDAAVVNERAVMQARFDSDLAEQLAIRTRELNGQILSLQVVQRELTGQLSAQILSQLGTMQTERVATNSAGANATQNAQQSAAQSIVTEEQLQIASNMFAEEFNKQAKALESFAKQKGRDLAGAQQRMQDYRSGLHQFSPREMAYLENEFNKKYPGSRISAQEKILYMLQQNLDGEAAKNLSAVTELAKFRSELNELHKQFQSELRKQMYVGQSFVKAKEIAQQMQVMFQQSVDLLKEKYNAH